MSNFIFIPANEYSIQAMQMLGIKPQIYHAQVNEKLLNKETPIKYVDRICQEKAQSIWQGTNVFAVHKAVFVGRRLILPPQTEEDIRKTLSLYSGRNHVIYTSICLKKTDGTSSQRRTFTRVKLRNLDSKAIEEFVASNQWQNQIGGYNPNGIMQKHIIKITGSHSGFLGLPAYETFNLINQM